MTEEKNQCENCGKEGEVLCKNCYPIAPKEYNWSWVKEKWNLYKESVGCTPPKLEAEHIEFVLMLLASQKKELADKLKCKKLGCPTGCPDLEYHKGRNDAFDEAVAELSDTK